MKITTTIIRILFGGLLLFGSIPYFLKLFPTPELTGAMKTFNDGIEAAGYLVPLVKAIELLCGLAFVLNRFVVLATIVIFPIAVNILLVHSFLAPEGLPIAIFVMAANLFLAYRNKEHYSNLFIPKV